MAVSTGMMERGFQQNNILAAIQVLALEAFAARPEQRIVVVSHGATMGLVFEGAHPRIVCAAP